jgi:hypothetical protein
MVSKPMCLKLSVLRETSRTGGMGQRPKQGTFSAQSHAGNGMTFRMEVIPSI